MKKPKYELKYKPKYKLKCKPKYELRYKPEYKPTYKPEYKPTYEPAYKPEYRTERAWIEVNVENLRHNVNALRGAMPSGCELMAVVKAQAYGHGAVQIATQLNKMGVRAFAVATIEEGMELRKCGIRGDILILGYTDVRRASELREYNLTQTLIGFEYAESLNSQGIAVKTHIKIDTGMHRLGIPNEDAAAVKQIIYMKNLKTNGIFTHLCCSDSRQPEDVIFTKRQIDSFYSLINELRNSGISIPKLHIQSSYGLLNYPDLVCDYVRAGIALYGVLSSPQDDTLRKLDLRPALSLKSRIILIRSVKRGDSVGYGRSFIARRDTRIAILPVGYGDGFPRNLSNQKGSALINRHIVPVVGRICMDQLAVDITDAEEVSVGDAVTLIGAEGYDELSAPFVADCSGSISNELLCRMGARLPVLIKATSKQ